MRILILANNDVGLYKFRKELMEELVKENDVFACLPNGDLIPQVEKLGVKFIQDEFDRHGTNPISEIKHYFKYKKVINKVKPDIVFTYTVKPNVFGGAACANMKVPYIVNVTGLGTAVEKPGLMQKIMIPMYKFGIRKAQKVFFQNAENREFMLSRNMIKGKHDLLPGSGVNLSQYKVYEYPNGDTVDFLFVARVMKEKGIDQYLEAAKHTTKKYPQTRFHICGACEPEYSGNLEELHNKGIVIYHGLVNDMTKMYEMASCTIHPTYYPEGLSNVLLESSACGRPIITTNRSGCREVVDDGINGYVVRERDSEDLIEKIEKFLALSWDDKRYMGMRGRAKVEKEFDRQIVVEKYLNEVETASHRENNDTNVT